MALVEKWHEEMQSAWLYRVLSEVERDPSRRALFAKLLTSAEAQAGLWAAKMRGTAEVAPASFQPSARARLVARLLRVIGPRPMRGMLAAMKLRGLSVYSGGKVAPGHVMPKALSDFGARHRGVSGGANLRAAVFGVNDGLVSNTSLILGVAAAAQEPRTVLLTGLAGLFAGACSMAAGEYLSMRSQRELFEYQIGLERDELDEYPEAEAEELALIYEARGLELEEARKFARRIIADPERALDTLAREELGLNPDELGSPWGAALFSFGAFAVGASLPLLPFLLFANHHALLVSVGIAAVSLFAVGSVLSLFTGRSFIVSGLRMLLIGAAAGLTTWLIGSWFGVSVS